MVVRPTRERAMQQFIPFDDRWFDTGEALPGPLVPYHVGMSCAHFTCGNGEDHCAAGGTLMNVATSPLRTPSLAASPAFNSST